MDTKQIPPAQVTPARPPAAPASSLRLYILLGLLAVVVGAYGYDYFVAKPGCEAADKKIQEFVDARNKLGVKDGALVTSADIQKELGMAPTYVEDHKDKEYTVEYYCWWGKMPMLSKRRHFISVVYVGPNRRVSSHHREEPPAEALPVDPSIASKANASADDPGSDAPAESPGPAEAPAPVEAPAKTSGDEAPAKEAPAKEPTEGDAKPDAESKTKSAEETPAGKS